jgi:hypothetical protein
MLRNRAWGAPHPRFPEKFSGFREPHAPFLKERRTRYLAQCCVQEIRGISLVFREMWDTTALDLRLLEPKHIPLQLDFSIPSCNDTYRTAPRSALFKTAQISSRHHLSPKTHPFFQTKKQQNVHRKPASTVIAARSLLQAQVFSPPPIKPATTPSTFRKSRATGSDLELFTPMTSLKS